MIRPLAIALAVAMVVAAVGLPLAAAGPATAVQEDDDPDDDIAPGERLSGVVGVQEAETRADVEDRTYGVRIARAATEEEAAEVVAERLGSVEQRLDELEERAERAEERRDAGELTEGQYRAEVAQIAAESVAAQRGADQAAETAEGLPADLLEAQGVNASAIQLLSDRAGELTGEEVAAIARSIAGSDVGTPVTDDVDVGPPEDLPRGADERGGADDRDAGVDSAEENTTDADRDGDDHDGATGDGN